MKIVHREGLTTEERLVLSNLVKRYPGVMALNDVSVDFVEGEVHAIVGENGAGKSTFIKIISGAIKPDEGSISIAGQQFSEMNPLLAKSCGVAVVYQELVQFEALSVAENIFMGQKQPGHNFVMDKKTMCRETQKLLDEFDCNIKPKSIVRNLSIANRQIVEIAKAMAQKAKIVIMDEPTSSITMEEQRKLFSIIRRLKNNGVTIIYISHRLEELFEICDRVTVLRDGKYITTKQMIDTDKADLIKLMVGRELNETYPPLPEPTGEVLLKTVNLSGNGVHDIDFELHRGEILGFGGLVGAGRTELMNLIYGDAKQKSGALYFEGKEFKPKHPADALAAGIGMIPEDRKGQGCFLDKQIDWNISVSCLKEISDGIVVSKRKENEISAEYKTLLQIKTPDLSHKLLSLSGGNQQKVVIAKTLAAHPDIIIFDEPTRGIDVGARYEIYLTMIELARQGKAILMVSSDMEELLGMSHRIVVLYNGRQAGILPKKEFSQNRILEMASGE